jgi:hypothetical protein
MRAAGLFSARHADWQRGQSALERAMHHYRDRHANLDTAREKEVEAQRRLKAAGVALVDAVAAWAPDILVIEDREAVIAELQAWVDAPRGTSALEEAAHRALAAALAEIAQEQAQWSAEKAALETERNAALEEQHRLLAGRHTPPEPPWTRRRPADQRGAPLWQLCDFQGDVDDLARVGLESALEGAGLLDAWVTPDGAVLAAGMLDAALTLDAPEQQPSLAAVLEPWPHPDVPDAIVHGVLARIGLRQGLVHVDLQATGWGR